MGLPPERDDEAIVSLWNADMHISAILAALHIGKQRFYQRVAVLREAGRLTTERCNGNGTSYAKAEYSKPPPEREHTVKMRLCMMCRAEFKSLWAGHRVCKRCQGLAVWRQG